MSLASRAAASGGMLHDAPVTPSRGDPSPLNSGDPTMTNFFPSLPKVQRIPREGPTPGGGIMTVTNRGFFETQLREALHSADSSMSQPNLGAAGNASDGRLSRQGQQGQQTQGARRPSAVGGNGHGQSVSSFPGGIGRSSSRRSVEAKRLTASSGFEDESPRSSAGGGALMEEPDHPTLSAKQRRQQEMYFKWQKTEALRERDRTKILEKIDRAKERRDNRFKRLLSEVCGEGNLAQVTAQTMRDRAEHEEHRRRELLDQWNKNVYGPLQEQADQYLNPPDRALEQRKNGFKTVDFQMPDEEFKMIAKNHKDPGRRVLAEHASDNAFHQTAEQFLNHSTLPYGKFGLIRSQSAPTVQAPSGLIPKAQSKDTLDPTVWSQQQIQGTLYGFWAQKCESGAGFKRSLRGGPGIHIPDETDGVMAAGSRISRIYGYHDKGVLRGECGSRGETSEVKAMHGTSCGAPAQDHYNFVRGHHITDLEFPLGKRPPPEGTR
eukprot:CAMPEP_0206430022 /NCGR_PEP_ID=MMETSP0324_2-20121206/6575_1 /ASSEMBLY_ACC=CAM_ASM_000836 /TAXON_ID=2866 /ORGANISM="Crypthecodinium cohnii, Strain Seligo" /LENGTH=491 /DNA_ID=CAMNT_0053895787 /DNA_START=37 /DNA_END=1509 /DNA_ORIENTATION=+